MRRLNLTMRLVVIMVFASCLGAEAQGVVRKITPQEVSPEPAIAAKVLAEVREQFDVQLMKAAASGVLGAVVTGAPYSAGGLNETIQVLADGNRIVNRSSFTIARDSQGRVRREDLGKDGVLRSVMILDPVAETTYVLDPVNHTYRKMALVQEVKPDGAAPDAAVLMKREFKAKIDAQQAVAPVGGVVKTMTLAPTITNDGMLSMKVQRDDLTREPLGSQLVEGVAANGERVTSTIPAGSIGNQRPIVIVSEQWYSPELQVYVATSHSDPRSGDTTYKLTNIQRNEPDPALFRVPGDYAMLKQTLSPKIVRDR